MKTTKIQTAPTPIAGVEDILAIIKLAAKMEAVSISAKVTGPKMR
jgi:hypothetical protein